MDRRTLRRGTLPFAAAVLAAAAFAVRGQEGKPSDGPKRTPWTTSKITGSPEAPPPFRSERVFPNLAFEKPAHLVPFPGRKRWVVVEEKGKLFTFRNDPGCDKADLFIDLTKELTSLDKVEGHRGVKQSYAIAFDPDFEKNRTCWIMYVLRSKDSKKELSHGSRLSRFKVTDTDPPRVDPNSEQLVLTWLAGGHNGCDLQWGNDGYLYVSTGDGERPDPPDTLRAGQDVSNLLSAILRIDVRGARDGQGYRVPPDNPFVGRKGMRPEIWAYGFRNPWRISFDRKTGRLWLGDVGWERWELVHCVEKGGNYGWSVMEGPTPCNPDWERGPTPIRPPAHALPHPVSASVTGGFVYRGKRLKGYEGQYIYGDWETRRVWANPVRVNTLGPRKEIARTPYRIVAFAEEEDGEILILDHEKGYISRLVPNEGAAANANFPKKLSETGLFSSVADQIPAPGVIPYSINAPAWADGASAQRWIAIPGRNSIQLVDKNDDWPRESVWPKDSVMAKSLRLDGRTLETQVLHFDGQVWNAYAYAWNREQTDATRVGAAGTEIDLGKGRRWKIQARSACLTCHNPWPGYSLTINSAQLDRTHRYPEGEFNQIRAFQDMGILPRKLKKSKPLVDPHQDGASLDDRARSYLSVNCSFCHRFGGGGSARIDLRHTIPLKEMEIDGFRPTLGDFGLADPFLIAGKDPSRSVLLYRTYKLGPGRMPHIGSEVVDDRGVQLLARWIESRPAAPCDPKGTAARAEDRKAVAQVKAGSVIALDRVLASPSATLDLLQIWMTLPEIARKRAILRGLTLPPGPVRDLFERFEPPGKRRKRLGTSINPSDILTLRGDVERGRRLFASPGTQCGKCHTLGSGQETLGPDLVKSKIGAKYTRAQILESILEPTRKVDPKYAGIIVQTKDDEIYNGILVSKSEKEIVIRDAAKEMRIPVDRIRRTVPQAKSLMPEFLIQSLTPQEAADLLDFLKSLR